MSPPPAEDRSNSYFVVAVVKRNSSYAFTLDELRGKRSCHPGFGSLAGWDIPVGALVQRGFIRPRDCDVLTGTISHSTQANSSLGLAEVRASSEGWGPLPAGPHRRQPQGDFLFLLDVPFALGKVGGFSWPHCDRRTRFCGGCQCPYTLTHTQSGIGPVGWEQGKFRGSGPGYTTIQSWLSPWASGRPCWKVGSPLCKCEEDTFTKHPPYATCRALPGC